jgi:adenylate cyclase class 2
MQEIEVKFLDIDKDALIAKLEELGAEKVGTFRYIHTAMDFPDYRLNKDNSWVRIRDEDGTVTCTFKKRLGVTSQDGSTNDMGMEEVEITVSSYQDMKQIFKKVGMIEKHEAEKIRTRYVFDGVECDIDEIPLVPAYLELEGESMQDLERVAVKLGFNFAEHKVCSAHQLLRIYNLDPDAYQKLTFAEQVKK